MANYECYKIKLGLIEEDVQEYKDSWMSSHFFTAHLGAKKEFQEGHW